MSTTEQVLSDFMDAWNAGRRPRVREYLERVPEGAARDALADQLTTWLEVAPAPEHSPEARAAIRSSAPVASVLAGVGSDAGLWPSVVPRLRNRAGLSIADLASRLVERFGLSPSDRSRTAAYLERLESGSLDGGRVSRRLLDALGAALGPSGATLADAAGFGRGLRPATQALFRAESPPAARTTLDDLTLLSRAALTPADEPADELDRLFTGGPDA